MARPKSVTIIGWWLIITGLWGAFSSATIEMNPQMMAFAAEHHLSLAFQEIFGLINGLACAACGIGMLKGLSWARLAYFGSGLVGIVVGILMMPSAAGLIVVGLALIFYLVTVSFLCRQPANLWFEFSGN